MTDDAPPPMSWIERERSRQANDELRRFAKHEEAVWKRALGAEEYEKLIKGE